MVFGWLSALEVIGVILVLLGLCLVGLAVRRRWLARNGGTFECSMSRRVVRGTSGHGSADQASVRADKASVRADKASIRADKPTGRPAADSKAPSIRWVLGVARYSGENFEWFRFFSLAWWPKYTFQRRDVSVLDHRVPVPSESVALYADQEIVRVAIAAGSTSRQRQSEQRELAMTPESLTGMLSWLEAAPPGIGPY